MYLVDTWTSLILELRPGATGYFGLDGEPLEPLGASAGTQTDVTPLVEVRSLPAPRWPELN